MPDNESTVFSTLSYSVDQSCGVESGREGSLYPSTSTTIKGSYEQLQFESNLWIELAEIFLELGKVSEVQHCINEACTLYPQFYQAMYLKGRVFHCLGRLSEAKSCYFAAIGISPYHIPSLCYLVMAYEAEGNRTMAEQVLKDMVKIDSMNYHTWLAFGKLLINQKKFSEAAECYEKALALEKTTPLLPFSVIPRSIRFFVG
ncbi:unnamed protein product [Soboliphyme baturini]|uniref:TPR_REGION domain-containing protein n=1 Tax=Soboliphyme baturini TaxID=241478 RepID=A0A183J4L4_9BILA|nr:unnamed protein product [Soboliphyme baturini]